MKKINSRWIVVVLYATAMAWVESAVVYYLRTYIDRIEPYQPNPLPIIGGLGPAEMVREAATLIMLLTVGYLAGRNTRGRLGYAAIAFGVWDIFYYVFLKAMCGWPHGITDWDILFLLPLPWWGPVVAPMCIALLMIVWGTLVCEQRDAPPARFTRRAWGISAIGAGLGLYVFMEGTLHAAKGGVDALRNFLPERFDWPWFTVALACMSAPILHLLWNRPRNGHRTHASPALAISDLELTNQR
jgi:hypothetical protein